MLSEDDTILPASFVVVPLSNLMNRFVDPIAVGNGTNPDNDYDTDIRQDYHDSHQDWHRSAHHG